jgi:hypothetical protein
MVTRGRERQLVRVQVIGGKERPTVRIGAVDGERRLANVWAIDNRGSRLLRLGPSMRENNVPLPSDQLFDCNILSVFSSASRLSDIMTVADHSVGTNKQTRVPGAILLSAFRAFHRLAPLIGRRNPPDINSVMIFHFIYN